MRYKIASAFLRVGATLGTQANERVVREIIYRLHPRRITRPLIRIGGEHDGGYLVPDDLDGIVACFSPGVATTATFEQEIVKRGIPCFLADGSVQAAPISHDLVHFEKIFIGVTENARTTTMDRWVALHAPPKGDLLLQMDIEGAEWPALLNISDDTLRRFRIIVMELHDLDRLLDKVGFTLIGSVLDRLLNDFHIVHNHPNNTGGVVAKGDIVLPRVMEATFIRKDRAKVIGYADRFPHPLDRPNMPALPDVILPPVWYHGSADSSEADSQDHIPNPVRHAGWRERMFRRGLGHLSPNSKNR
jgi:hypothetical protein